MNEFENLSKINRTLINFVYYVECENGELQDSYLEQLDNALADGHISDSLLAEARELMERLSRIISIASDKTEIAAKNRLKTISY